MVRVILSFLSILSFVQLSFPFGVTFAHLLNLRCEFSDSFLKPALEIYDQVIASKIVSFYIINTKDGESFKIPLVNGSYQIEHFDQTKPTRVIIHGFWNSHTSRINKAMKAAYLTNFDVNLIIVNYSRISRDVCYKIARSRVGMLGRKIASFLDHVLGTDEFQWENLAIIGHSLGGHTAGVVGRSVKNGRVGSIIALDIAAPGFEMDSDIRLKKSDAGYVECLHTNGKTLGLMEPICTVDIYPNFGLTQPGCNLLMRALCSHSRAWKLFAESLQNRFIAHKCESMRDIREKNVCDGAEIVMGGDDNKAKMNESGIFFLSTNENSPFSKDSFKKFSLN